MPSTTVYAGTDVPVPLPDPPPGEAGKAASVLAISDVSSIGDLNVTVDVTGTPLFTTAVLIAPDSTRVELFSNVFNFSDGLSDTTFDDEAGADLPAGPGSLTGTFRPSGRLSDLDGKAVNGVWRLEVSSTGFGSESINAWSLEVTGTSPLPDLRGVTFDAAPVSAAWGQAVRIDYSLTNSGPTPAGAFTADVVLSADPTAGGGDLVLTSVTVPGLAAGASVADGLLVTLPAQPPPGFEAARRATLALRIDPGDVIVEGNELNNANAGLARDSDQIVIPPAGATLHLSPDVPRTIPQSGGGPSTAVSTLAVTDDVLVGDLNVTVDVSGNPSFLSADLVAPDGTRVGLFVGTLGFTTEPRYFGTTFDDEAALGIGSGTPPFPGTFWPTGLLSAFDGKGVNGVWRLEVTSALPTGTEVINGWALEVTEAVPLPDLRGESFNVAEASAAWGQTVQVDYELRNAGGAAAGAFAVDVVLSADSAVGDDDLVLTTLTVIGLEAGGTATGRLAVTLPAAPPGAFGGRPTLGLRIDPDNAVNEGDERNNAGTGPGRDSDRLYAARPGVAVYVSPNLSEPVPPSGLNSSIRIPDDGLIDDLDLVLDVGHPAAGSIRAVLTGPDGTQAELFNRVGAPAGTGFDGTTFDDQAAVAIAGGVAPFVGRFRPAQALAAFAGKSLRGNWVLSLTSPGGAEGVSGTLAGWALAVRATPPPDLRGETFTLAADGARWGDTVPGDFTLVNAGTATAGRFAVTVVLSADPVIGADVLVLDRLTFSGLPAGGRTGDSLRVRLPGTPTGPPAGFAGFGPFWVGLRVDPDGAVTELSESDNANLGPGRDVARLIPRVFESEPNSGPAAGPLAADAELTGRLVGADADEFQFAVAETGRLTAAVGPESDSFVNPRLELLDAAGRLLARSDDRGPTDAGAEIVLHLGPGTYRLRVSRQAPSAHPGSDDYRLATRFEAANLPGRPAPTDAGSDPNALSRGFLGPVVGDFTGDGRADLLTFGSVSLTLLPGVGGGTFAAGRPVGPGGTEFAVADLNADGLPDVVTAGFDTITVYRNDRGSFTSREDLTAGLGGIGRLALADVNGDGGLDLVVVGGFGGGGLVRLGLGGGRFDAAVPFTAFEGGPLGGSFLDRVAAVADLTGDGKADLIVNQQVGGPQGDYETLVRPGNGDGTFGPARTVASAGISDEVVVADFNADGRPDLAYLAQEAVEVALQGPGGLFAPRRLFETVGPTSLRVADATGDGRPDVLFTDNFGSDAVLLAGNGDGTFRPARRFSIGQGSVLAVGDLDGDGEPDLAGVSKGSRAVVLLGNGDGTFRFRRGLPPNVRPVGDLSGDGRPDLISTRFLSFLDPTLIESQLLLGTGDAGFLPGASFPGVGITDGVADVNRDGRPDVVRRGVPSNLLGAETPPELRRSAIRAEVLLGNGDGTFQPPAVVFGTEGASAVEVADFDRDGLPDLVVTKFGAGPGLISVWLGRGDGTFQLATPVPDPGAAGSPLVADVNGDGLPDLVVVDASAGAGAVLVNAGGGRFDDPPRPFAVSKAAFLEVPQYELLDLDGDRRADLVNTRFDEARGAYVLTIRPGRADGGLGPGREVVVESVPPEAVIASGLTDLTGDGTADFVVSEPGAVAVVPGDGRGGFGAARRSPTGTATLFNVVAADLDGDGRRDLFGESGPTGFALLLGVGDGTFVPVGVDAAADRRATPFRLDLDGDGTPDVALLDGSGSILFRRGLPGPANRFEPPVVLNPANPARDVTPVRVPGGWALAAADALGDTVALYAVVVGSPRREVAFTAGLKPVRVAAADLTADGLDELVTADALGNTVTVALQLRDGFLPLPSLPVGGAPTDLAFADLDGRFGPDLVVTGQTSGDVTVLYNSPGSVFGDPARYRAGAGPYGLEAVGSGAQVRSFEQPVTAVAGRFTDDARADLVVVGRGSRQLVELVGAAGGFLDAGPARTYALNGGAAVNDRPGQTVSADFDNDGDADLAVLMEDAGQVWVYANDGDGGFTHTDRVETGTEPTGLSVEDVDGDGVADLMVGNGFGDVLFVLGNGSGGFKPFVRADQRVPFVATDLNGDGQTDVVLADQARDRAGSMLRVPGSTAFVPGAFQQDGSDGLIGPGDVAEADLDGRHGTDLVFANSGSNNVLVYLRRADGSFEPAPLSFPVGTNPVALEVARLDGDDRPDLAVANQGSNDVSVLLGGVDSAGNWTFRPGPRLQSGGTGLNAVSARELTGDGVADLLVTNGQDGTLTVLPGIGSASGAAVAGTGFFDDVAPRPQRVAPPAAPIVQTLALPPVLGQPPRAVALTQDGGLVAVNLASFAPAPAAPGFARPVTAADSFAAPNPANPFPLLVVAGAGFVSILTTADGATFVESRTLFDPGLGSPSALEVLAGPGGSIEVYLTDAGEGVPLVLRFGPDDILPTDPGGEPGGPDVVVAPLGGAPLAVVATLVSGLPIDPAAPNSPGAPGGGDGGRAQSPAFGLSDADPSAGFDSGFEEVLAGLGDADLVPTAGALVLLALLGDPSGSEEEDAEPEEPATLEQFVTGLEESLRRLLTSDSAEPPGGAAPTADAGPAPPAVPSSPENPAPVRPEAAPVAAATPSETTPAPQPEPGPVEEAGWAVDVSEGGEALKGAGQLTWGWDKAAVGAALVAAGAAYRGWARRRSLAYVGPHVGRNVNR